MAEKRETKALEIGEAKSLKADIKFGLGKLKIGVGAGDKLCLGDFSYDDRWITPEVEYKEAEGVGKLTVSHKGDPLDWISIALTEISKDIIKWDLRFTDQIPIDLTLNMGANDCDVDLTSLKISALEMNIGATDMDLWFNEPNEIELKSIKVRAGAADLVMKGLGNANMDAFEFQGGAGDFKLDFSGDLKGEVKTKFSMGVGKLDLQVPKSLGVRIKVTSFLGDLNMPGLNKVADTAVSENYDPAEGKLDVDLDMGLGQFNFKFIEA
jgi:hypothetical protein